MTQPNKLPYATHLFFGAFLTFGAINLFLYEFTNTTFSSMPSKWFFWVFLFFGLCIISGLIPMRIAHARHTRNANAVYWLAFFAMWCPPANFALFLTALIMATTGKRAAHPQGSITEFKIEIVNNKKYLGAKKLDRVKYLQDLKKRTVAAHKKYHKELSNAKNRLNDIPKDIAEYIKPKNATPHDTLSLKHKISILEDKITAIDELINSETKMSKAGRIK